MLLIWIDRKIIDEVFQGKGYGKEAMKQLIKLVAKEYGVDTIYLSVVKEMNERDPNGALLFQYRV